MGDAGAHSNTLHVVVLPWLAFGHLTPFLELSKRVARLGHRVSFVSTPANLRRLPAVPTDLAPLLRLVPLPLPSVPGLPAGVEATVDLPDGALRPYLSVAFDALEPHLTALLRSSSPPPDWILYDYSPHWIPRVARQLGARCAYVALFNASVHSFIGPPEVLMGSGDGAWTRPDQFTARPGWVPFPTGLFFRAHEAREVFGPAVDRDESGVSEFYRVGASIEGSDVVAIRSCMELEPESLRLLPELYRKPVIPVGHFPPPPVAHDSGDDRRWAKAFDWLDNQPHGSVVYAAFGSEVRFSMRQLHEIASGLEQSGLPFFWALRRPRSLEESLQLLPEGFEGRTMGRGVVCEGWVPQVRILAHPAIGGFLTHCGWNSLVEGLRFGLALILLPMVFDQALNARLMGEKGLGVEVPRDEVEGEFDGAGIAKTMRLVMVEEEGEPCRAKARELRGALGDNEVQDQYVRDFVEYLTDNGTPTSPVGLDVAKDAPRACRNEVESTVTST